MANHPKKNQLKRNERERKRVHQVNDGFDLLRTRLRPAAAANKKLSKADTLREAVNYIKHLQELLSQSQDLSYASTSTNNFFHVKQEFDAYFPPQFGTTAPDSSQFNAHQSSQQQQYTSPSSSSNNSTYSPPPTQIYYSPNHTQTSYYHQNSP